jgi:competence protein ComEA
MRRIVLMLFVSLLFSACSSRVEYVPTIAPPDADAININTATVDELEKLPHIGRKTAEAIIQFRIENGPFRRVENLFLIRGVSETRFAELREFVRVQ